jgi:hypothetical protein
VIERHKVSRRQSVLIVHGRDFKPAADSFIESTSTALRAGLERDYPDVVAAFDGVQKEFVYYGDLSNELLLEAGGHYDETLDIGDRSNALAALRAIPTRKRFGIRQYDRLPGKSAFGEFAADLFSPVLGVLGLWMWACSRKSRDFYEYLKGDLDYAERVRERIREKLVPLLLRGDQVMLITHGTGSAVAWDVLWELSHDAAYADVADAKVEVFVTLGSPLGDNSLRKRLIGARKKGLERFPTNIITWHNIAAEDDYTCHDGTLADDFKKMLSEHLVSAVKDHKIYNHAVRYGKSNPHSSIGYFIHPRMSKIVADWLAAAAVTPPDPRTP